MPESYVMLALRSDYHLALPEQVVIIRWMCVWGRWYHVISKTRLRHLMFSEIMRIIIYTMYYSYSPTGLQIWALLYVRV